MPETYLRQSALAHLHLAGRAVADPGEAGVLMCERPPRGQIDLRGRAGEAGFRSAVEGALGLAPPVEPNTVAAAEAVEILWLGPDEWLVVTPEDRRPEVLDGLRAALAGRTAAVTDVSESRAVIGLAGARAREVLMKGCGLDLHPRVFGPGRCAQTLLARAQILLQQVGGAPVYDVYVHRSFAEYLWRWLEDAAGEYGLAVVETIPPPGAEGEQGAT